MLNKRFILGGLLAMAGSANAAVIWTQPSDGSGNGAASQYDPLAFGNFATAFDNFTISIWTNLTGFSWVGEYFNLSGPAQITAWTVTLYSDAGGQPGGAIKSWTFAGDGGETDIGSFGGYENYAYSESFAPLAASPGVYWVSVVPDLVFQPQWAWVSGIGGDSKSFQDLFGARDQLTNDLAFSVDGYSRGGVPEPATWTLMLTGLGALGASLRSRRKAAAA